MPLLAAYESVSAACAALFGSGELAHVNAGLATYVGAQVVLRDRRASLCALQVAATMAVVDEAAGRLLLGNWGQHHGPGEVVAMLFWPAVLFALGRYRRRCWRARIATERSRKSSPASRSFAVARKVQLFVEAAAAGRTHAGGAETRSPYPVTKLHGAPGRWRPAGGTVPLLVSRSVSEAPWPPPAPAPSPH